MKEIWKKVKIKNFGHFRVSNLGRLKNTRTKHITKGFICYITLSRGPMLSFQLYNKGLIKVVTAHKLVFTHFKKSELEKYSVWHKDYIGSNNKETNLEDISHSEMLRRSHREINRKRGVYKWSVIGDRNKFRAALKVNEKVITLGYTKRRKEAQILYEFGYAMIYGVKPYSEAA